MKDSATGRFPLLPLGSSRQRVIRCSRCGTQASIGDNGRDRLPDVMVAKKFQQLGWAVSNAARKDQCPQCAAGKAQRRAAYCRMAGVPKAKQKESPVGQPATPAVAEPPRVSSVAERRRIMDALEEHYDQDAQRYRAAFTDAAVAEKVKLPRAWVSDLRELMFGPEANEAQVKRAGDILALEQAVANLENQVETALTTWSATAASLRAEIARLSR